jgi:hypothetical protein
MKNYDDDYDEITAYNNYKVAVLSSGIIPNIKGNTEINKNHGLITTSLPDYISQGFLLDKDFVTIDREYYTTYSDMDTFVKEVLFEGMFKTLSEEKYSIRGGFIALKNTEEEQVMLNIRPRMFNKTITIIISYQAPFNKIIAKIEEFEKKFDLERKDEPLSASYAYINDGRISYFSEVSVRTLDDFYPECYPYIGNVDTFIEDYMNSTSNVLILTGEPGTGKSTFINYLLHKTKSSCYVAYDEAVMRQDGFFIDFMSDDAEVMILEDADIILRSRIKDNNKIMSKILNISDGILSLKHKKFIFTANIEEIDEIDKAISRPGRCYDIVNFRSLTRLEGQKAAVAMGIELEFDKSEYTVAEIYNNKRNSDTIKSLVPKQKVGFLS